MYCGKGTKHGLCYGPDALSSRRTVVVGTRPTSSCTCTATAYCLNSTALPCLALTYVALPCCAVLCHAGMGMERALFIRERNDGLYRPVTYLLYKLLDELLLMLPVTSATTATVFLACRLQGSFLLFWLVNYVTLANGTGGAHALFFGQAIQSTNRRGS